MNLYQCPAVQIRKNRMMQIKDNVCIEDTFRLYLNDELLVELIATSAQLEELGAGFVVCEGLARASTQLAQAYFGTGKHRGRHRASSGGIAPNCGQVKSHVSASEKPQIGEERMRSVWSLYSEKAIKHFRNPRKVGEIESPDGIGYGGDPAGS